MPIITPVEKIAYDDVVVHGLRKEDLESKDFIFNLPYDGNLGQILTRAEIEAALVDNGLPNPVNTVSFRIFDSSGNVFAVTYFDGLDVYVYVAMKLAS